MRLKRGGLGIDADLNFVPRQDSLGSSGREKLGEAAQMAAHQSLFSAFRGHWHGGEGRGVSCTPLEPHHFKLDAVVRVLLQGDRDPPHPSGRDARAKPDPPPRKRHFSPPPPHSTSPANAACSL
ncbi:UNVERIFIED_CONTAM: hypothetical protein K2H54_044150 [Gekko kuhli]